MNKLFFNIYQRIAFLIDPERSHDITLKIAEIIYKFSKFLEIDTSKKIFFLYSIIISLHSV